MQVAEPHSVTRAIMTQPSAHLFIIDPQNDFCDLPGAALPVEGADADMERLAAFIRAAGPRLAQISLTLDTHQPVDIAHPGCWQQADGQPVAPFTQIRAADLAAGRYRAVPPLSPERTLAYLKALEAGGRYTHMIWPVHCVADSWGHQIHAGLAAALADWARDTGRSPVEVIKGTHPWTEHYSAIQAEVPDPAAPETLPNTALLARFAGPGLILVAGEASSHCVRASVEHLAAHLPSQRLDKLVLLTDGMSPVPGFEAQARDFLAGMQARGMRLATQAEVLRTQAA